MYYLTNTPPFLHLLIGSRGTTYFLINRLDSPWYEPTRPEGNIYHNREEQWKCVEAIEESFYR